MTNDKLLKINSFLAASAIAETNLCVIISTFIEIPKVSVLLMMCILLSVIALNKNELKISRKSTVATVLFFLLLILSIFINGLDVAGERLIYFFTFGVTSMLLVSVKHMPRYIMKDLLIIYLVYIVIYFLFKRSVLLDSDEFWSEQMGVAYAFAAPIIISMAFILFYKSFREKLSNNNRKNLLSIFVLLILTLSLYVILFDAGTRGVLVVIAVAFFLFFKRKIPQKYRMPFYILGAVSIVVLFLNWEQILISSLDRFAEGNVRSLKKLSMLAEAGDASNGRESLFGAGLEMIKDNPFGYGVGYYENITKSPYVHQLILELLLEVGVLGLLIFIGPILKFIKRTRLETNDIKFSFNIFLLTYGLLPLMFMGSFWLYPPFWFAYFYALNCKSIQQTQFAMTDQYT